jgi:hypothetical protein
MSIRHILSLIPCKKVPREKVKLPKRSMKGACDDQAAPKGRKFVPEEYWTCFSHNPTDQCTKTNEQIMIPLKTASTRFGSFLLVAFILCLSREAARSQLPPLTTVPGSPRLPGKFVWADLVTDDVPAARRFYGRMFGWTFREVGNYTIAANDERPLAGMFQLSSRWRTTTISTGRRAKRPSVQ